jgi:hypothetical protein
VYAPEEINVIEVVVAPLLHNSAPPDVVLSFELPQLFATVTEGVAGTAMGTALPEPAALAQPSTAFVITV